MKKLNLLLIILCSVFITSCGGGEKLPPKVVAPKSDIENFVKVTPFESAITLQYPSNWFLVESHHLEDEATIQKLRDASDDAFVDSLIEQFSTGMNAIWYIPDTKSEKGNINISLFYSFINDKNLSSREFENEGTVASFLEDRITAINEQFGTIEDFEFIKETRVETHGDVPFAISSYKVWHEPIDDAVYNYEINFCTENRFHSFYLLSDNSNKDVVYEEFLKVLESIEFGNE